MRTYRVYFNKIKYYVLKSDSLTVVYYVCLIALFVTGNTVMFLHICLLQVFPGEGEPLLRDTGTMEVEPHWSEAGLLRPFRCSLCPRVFRRKEQLKLHFRTHTGERPHKCRICFASFSRPSNLSAHMRIHTGERPFVCDICHMRFSQSNNLKRHMKCHVGEPIS